MINSLVVSTREYRFFIHVYTDDSVFPYIFSIETSMANGNFQIHRTHTETDIHF